VEERENDVEYWKMKMLGFNSKIIVGSVRAKVLWLIERNHIPRITIKSNTG
jgi:hypothetical protein